MPIFRYFVFVGGALLALLFAANFVYPAAPEAQAVASASNDQPLIRIRSDRLLPERVVLDTSQPTLAAPAVKTAAVVSPQPPAPDSMSAALAETSAKARVRDTFAQFTPPLRADTTASGKPEAKPQAAQAQISQGRVSTQASTVQAQPKRKVAKTHPAPQQGRPMIVAQQPHFGLFDTTW
jgi:hypothetical protein